MNNKFFAALAAAVVAFTSSTATYYADYEEADALTADESETDALPEETAVKKKSKKKSDDDYPEIRTADGGFFRYDEASGNTYYILDGKRVRGLCRIDGKIYYFGEGGIMKKGESLSLKDGRKFLFSKDGSAYTGRTVIGGKEYTFSANGIYLGRHFDTDIVDSSDMYTYDELVEDLDELKAHYPELFDYSVIGRTADRRNIYDITIGDKEADRQLVFVASCHAREYMTSLLVMDMAEYILNSYYMKKMHGVPYKDILSEYTIHIVPMLNPDGVTISQFGPDGLNNPSLRKNARTMYKNAKKWGYTSLTEENYYVRWKANARGVDLNRNFDAKWDIIETLRGRCGENFKGFEPMSELESICIADFVKSLSNPETVISYHATGSMIYWDYGQTGRFREKCEKQINIVKKLTGYRLLDYSKYSSGGLSDYIIAEGLDIVPETIEIGTTPAPVDMSEYDEIFRKNKLIPISVAEMYLDWEDEPFIEEDEKKEDYREETEDEDYDVYYPGQKDPSDDYELVVS